MKFDGIIDNLKVIGSYMKNGDYLSIVDEDGKLINNKKQLCEYIKKYKQRIKNGEIPRFTMYKQISTLACYKGLDDIVNKKREETVAKLNNDYYNRMKMIKLKQCD